MKVLLLDSAFSAVPIHEYLTDIGCEVWTMGNRACDALAVAYPERWIAGSYGDPVLVGDVVRKHRFDALIPGCTDVSMHSFAHAEFKSAYNYTPEMDRTLNNKPLFRRLCDELNLPAPRAISVDRLPTRGLYICKPADSFSGRGVTVFDAADKSSATRAIEEARTCSPSRGVVCEDYVEGQLYSYSAFLERGFVDAAYIVREGSRYDPYAVDTSYVCDDYNKSHAQQLRDAVETVSRRLDLCDGLLHVQFIDAGDRVAILEMTRRCPGDLYSRLIEYSADQPYAARYASYFLSKRVEAKAIRRRYVLRHTIKQSGSERFCGLNLDLGSCLFQVIPVVRLGEAVDPSKMMRVGVAFLEATNVATVDELYRELVTKGA